MLTRIIRRDDSVSLRQYQNLNAENPLGTMQSIEHALRSLDKLAEHEQERVIHAALLSTNQPTL